MGGKKEEIRRDRVIEDSRRKLYPFKKKKKKKVIALGTKLEQFSSLQSLSHV